MTNQDGLETIVHTSATIRITGDEQEINLVLDALKEAGFEYRLNATRYPAREPRRFNLYLNWVKVPATVINLGDPADDF